MKAGSYRQIAQDLERQIRTDSEFVLPTLLQLCEQKKVSYCTAWRAYQLLIEREVLVTSRGRKMAIASSIRKPEQQPSVQPLTDRLYEMLCKRIIDGEYRSGERFPKTSYFVVTEGVSHPIVSRAFLRLANEGLAHKLRNRWVVGSEAQLQSDALPPSANRPTVLVLTPDMTGWNEAFIHPFSSMFVTPFMDQLVKYNHNLEVVNQWHRSTTDEAIPTGLDEVVAESKSLGESYGGILLNTVFPRETRLDNWIRRMYSPGKPMVYFDVVDKGGYLTRESLSVKEDYYRLHVDERHVVTTALRALSAAGHRTLGIHAAEVSDWTERRAKLLQEIAPTMDPPMEVVLAAPARPHWRFHSNTGLHNFVDEIRKKLDARQSERSVKSEPFRRALIEESSPLVSLLCDHPVTALIGLNDEMAWEYCHWCRLVGIKIPGDLSIVAFDNLPQSVLFHVSSVDFGLSRLGYLAAHILIGDLPIKTDRNGFISGEPTFVDRGSVGQPGDRKRLRRLLRG